MEPLSKRLQTLPYPLQLCGMLMVAGILVILPTLAHGLFRSYLWAPDPDYFFIYDALLINSGLPQAHFNHPGVTLSLLLSWWLKIAEFSGVLPLSGLTELNQAKDFEAVFTDIVVAARLLALGLVSLFCLLVFLVARIVTSNVVAAAMAMIVIAGSNGLGVQSLIVRTDVLAMSLALMALISVLLSARNDGIWATVGVGCAAFFGVLAMLAKIQVIEILIALPVLAMLFGKRAKAAPPIEALPEAWPKSMVALSVAACYCMPSAIMAVSAIIASGQPGTAVQSVLNQPFAGFYQLLLLCYFGGAVAAYGKFFGHSGRQCTLSIAAMSVGIASGFYFSLIYHNISNTHVLVNFIEHLSQQTTVSETPSESGTSFDAALQLVTSFLNAHFISPVLFRVPEIIIGWFSIVGIVFLGIRKKYLYASRALVFLGLAFATEIIASARYYAEIYYVYSQVWLVLSGAVIVAALQQFENRVKRVGMVIAVALSVLFLAGSLKYSSSEAVDQNYGGALCLITGFHTPLLTHHFRHLCP